LAPEHFGAALQAVRIGFLIVLALMIGIIKLDPEHFGAVLRLLRLGFLIVLVTLMIDIIR
jgi:hypothetical protein